MKKNSAQKIVCEALITTMNEDLVDEQNPRDLEFHKGYQAGVKARVYGGKYSMDDEQLKNYYPPAFVKGYRKATGQGWWDRFNDKLTTFAGRFGYSRTR